MTKQLLMVIAGLTLALCASLWGLRTTTQALWSTQAQVKHQEARIGAIEARVARVTHNVQGLSQRIARHDLPLNQALQQESDWSTAPVPPGVADGLCEFATCRQ